MHRFCEWGPVVREPVARVLRFTLLAMAVSGLLMLPGISSLATAVARGTHTLSLITFGVRLS
jgi:hypothetical protein